MSCREQFYSKFVIFRIMLEKDGGRKREGERDKREKRQSFARRVVTTMNRFRGNKTSIV